MSGAVAVSTRLVSLSVPGPAGSLEALLRIPPESRGAAIVAHPHPLHGGTMHTKVVHRAARLLSDRFSLTALRFNFRGVGASAGVHDGGRGEVEDLLAAIRYLRQRQPEGPFVLGGFSFGSVCAIGAAVRFPPDVLFLFGVPLDGWDDASASGIEASKVVWLQGTEDQFGAADRAAEIAGRLGWRLRLVRGADHFFGARFEAFERAAFEELAPRLGPAAEDA